MARIRRIDVSHFRGIKELTWCPAAGINCLIGPGDSGKSSVLDAIDLCLGARRNAQFTDADFHHLNVETSITISVTVGELDDSLRNLEAYGMYVRGFHAASGELDDEPESSAETVLTVKLSVGSDLEPSWSLVSDRAAAQGLERNLSWNDRVRIAPTRVGVMGDYHLGWRRGSVLNRVSEERADASSALARAARDARAAFGDEVQGQLGQTLDIVAATARELGIPIGDDIRAMLDTHSVSFGGGTISLHDNEGIPLRGMGIGSTRLLIAGLQRKAAAQATIILIDELEHGLEPHRIIRLLGSLGAKEAVPPLQVFMTTHSPVALRELAGSQLFVTRKLEGRHNLSAVGTENDIQGTIRLYPEAFLAPSVLVCEGASEVGFVRGLDQYRVAIGKDSIAAQGAALADCRGGDADRPFKRATAFCTLGYRAAVVRDNDNRPTDGVEAALVSGGGKVIAWREGRALEDELFLSLTASAIEKLIQRAIDLHGDELINEHIRSASQNAKSLDAIRAEARSGEVAADSRVVLGKASKAKKTGWFKSVTRMEDVARDIVGPDLGNADTDFRNIVDSIFVWVGNAG